MQKKQIADFFNSKVFKKVTFVLGILFLVLTVFIGFNPEPFLRFGYPGIFAFNLFGPGTLLIFSLASRFNIYGLAFVSAIGMAFNDSVAWIIGNSGTAVIEKSKKLRSE